MGHQSGYAIRQRGVVLFFALIALVVMSLAAVALIRSVDTNTLIAGNLAFKQASTSSGDIGVESAIAVLAANEANMKAVGSVVFSDPNNVFNKTSTATGYYSNTDPALVLTADAVWDAIDQAQVPEIVDQSGNHIRYVIQRMCRTKDTLPNKFEDPAAVPPKTGCLFSAPLLDNFEHTTPLPSNVCTPPPPPQKNGCPVNGQSPEYRITSRTVGPANTVSYVQTFVY
jgi:type IV pilus assembly protein PilX